MGRQTLNRIKKTASILLAILFVVSLTAVSAGATSSGSNTVSDIALGNSPLVLDPISFFSDFGINDASANIDPSGFLSNIGLGSILSEIFGSIPSTQ